MKIGGKAKAGLVNENLQAYQVKAQQNLEKLNCSEETSKLVTETLSKIRGLKVKDGKKQDKMAEVD